ncbi:hydantoinase/oxoprolinase family protein [Ramlibacter sp.]|uniref:hydantoinase/oxoprolinase family protein n=1 Tax=Ramlibacter sp. TaxID=1917967 RepID=UPI003D0FA029
MTAPGPRTTRAGVEVGGTFTDLVAFDGQSLRVEKVSSTTAQPEAAVFDALSAAHLSLDALDDLVHGSTVATNAVLERRGARTAFVTTAGFRDLLQLQRHDRRNVYELAYRAPLPLVAREHCHEVRERMLADGTVALSLDEDDVLRRLVPALRASGCEAVAICLLNAHVAPRHEQRVSALLREHLPGVFVTASHEVAREIREYERASTTAMAAYVQPVIDRYLGGLEARLAADGFRGLLTVMQSNGGRLHAGAMRRNAVTAMYSGPAAGVIGAVHQASLSGFENLVTFDMGGTSTDVSLVQQGRPTLAAASEVDGLPVRTPVLDIVTVGAGGGSIVELDEGGMLQVGPRSSGAQPGPACYGRGGDQPTVTDAHVLSGALQPDMFLGGRMALDADAARNAFASLAERFGSTPEAVAADALKLADASIVRAIQLVSTQRGLDPRDFVLVPYGGAGPLHAASVAADLGIRTIVVPPNPGVMSAFGLLAAPVARHLARTVHRPLDASAAAILRGMRDAMREEVDASLRELGLDEAPRHTLALDLRFVGQGFEVGVEVDASVLDGADGCASAAALESLFLAAYERIYQQRLPAGRPIEVMAMRVAGLIAPASVPRLVEAPQAQARIESREVWIDGERVRTRFAPVGSLRVGEPDTGPLVLQSNTSTIVVPAGWSVFRDVHENLILRRAVS